jgi:hypothetical protein
VDVVDRALLGSGGLMADSVDTLSSVTGLRREALLGIWDAVKANHAKLDACPGHDFGPLQPGNLSARYECRNCRGWADGSAVSWYQKGLAHGRSAG